MNDEKDKMNAGVTVVMPSEREQSAMPGSRAGLPAGSLPAPYFGAQGDEHSDPPSNAPTPIKPAVTVPADSQTGKDEHARHEPMPALRALD